MKLAFRLGSIPVYLHGSFLFVAVLLSLGGGDVRQIDPRSVLQWVVVVFVGVLLHELGHALVGKSFGLVPRIDLVSMGGLTSWSAGPVEVRTLGSGKRIAISLAGPFTGIVIGLGTWIYLRVHAGLPPLALFDGRTPFTELTYSIIFVNAGWGVLNLLPILPLDGGNVLFQVLQRFTNGNGEKPARLVSIGVAGAAGLWALTTQQVYAGVLALLFAMQNVQALRAGTARGRDEPLRAVVKGGFDALERGDAMTAIRAGNEVLSQAASPAIRADAVRLLAFAYLTQGAWGPLMELMESPASSAIGEDEMAKFEQAATELGRPEEAARIASIRSGRGRRPAF